MPIIIIGLLVIIGLVVLAPLLLGLAISALASLLHVLALALAYLLGLIAKMAIAAIALFILAFVVVRAVNH